LDGDGDRIAALGEDGNYISSHHLYAIVLWYLARIKKMKGKVVKSVNLSSIVDKICAKYNLELITTPVGFKHIAEEILKGGVIMGGEESGGLWAGGELPERDGMLMGLKLLEIICSMKTNFDILSLIGLTMKLICGRKKV
jgi:phosphomannomutase